MRSKMYSNNNRQRKDNRNRIFKQSRKNFDRGEEMIEQIEEPDYLKDYEENIRKDIIYSLKEEIPYPLPPLSIKTISFYRRSNQPVFLTRVAKGPLDPHLTYQSLTILAKIQQNLYPNYAALVKQFQRDLHLYLEMKSKDILEMAPIAAGNKILGREEDVLKILAQNPEDLWVLVNHVYENKIDCKRLFPYILQRRELAFKAIYELSNSKGDECISSLIDNQLALQCLFNTLSEQNQQIKQQSIRIIGNIIGDRQEYLQIFIKQHKLIDVFLQLLNTSNPITLKDTCWLISNFTCDNISAIALLRNQFITTKLEDLLYQENMYESLDIKKQILHIFYNLTHYAESQTEKETAYVFLNNPKLYSYLQSYLEYQDMELNIINLHILCQLLKLGEFFPSENGQNSIALQIGSKTNIFQQIYTKSMSQSHQISGLAITIINIIEGQQEQNGFMIL